MNNSTAICNVNGTYRSHPCRFDKGGGKKKYAFQQSEQTPPHRHFKGHLSVSWKSCHSTYHTGAGRRVAKDNLLLFPSYSLSLPLSHTCTHQHTHFSLSFRLQQVHLQASDMWFTEWGGEKEGHILLGGFILHLLYKCIKYAIVNVIKDRPECHYVW